MSGKAVREIVGLVGVVGSLVFVGWEIRQNTLAARAASYQAMGAAMADIWLGGVQDPELAALTLRHFEDHSAEFTPLEEARLVAQAVAAFRQYEAIWRQVELGLLRREALNYFGWVSNDLDTHRLWSRVRPYMNEDFRAFVESGDGPVGDMELERGESTPTR